MIQLYHFNNKDFESNGDIILLPQMCEVTAGINRTWQLDIFHPIDEEGRWKGLVNGAVIKAPSFKPYGTQLWRIVQTEKREDGISAVCDPISYDAAQEVFFIEKTIEDMTAQGALDSLCEGTIYRGYSDVEGRHTTYYSMANLIEIVQSHENGIQKTWGGEVGFNNYEIQLFNHIGGEPGTVISYGKNIAVDGFTESANIDGVITRLIPEGYGGRLMDGTVWVDSPLIDRYPTVRIGTINYDHLRLKGDPEGDAEKDGIYFDTKEELDAALREAALEEFANGLDKPKVNLEIDVVLLENTTEYAEFKNVDDLTLGDEVICRHQRLDVDTESRVIQVRFDCIKEKVVYVEIGDRKRNYFDNVSTTVESVRKAITPAGDVIASQIDGFINGAKAQLRLQSTVAEKQEAVAILFEDLDPESSTFGAMALGTQGFQISDTRTADGKDWIWSTFGTGKGFSADLIVAGTLSAINIIGSVITGGTITGTEINNGNGSFSVDQNGNLTANKATIKGSIETNGSVTGASLRTRVQAGFLITEYRHNTNPGYDTDIGVYGNALVTKGINSSLLTQVRSDGFFCSNDGGNYMDAAVTAGTISVSQDSNNGVWLYNTGRIVVKRNGETVFSVP